MSEKVYVGRGWKSKFGVRISLKKADIEKLPTNKYGDVLLEVSERREPDEKSKATHYVVVDQYSYDKLNGATEAPARGGWDAKEDPF